MSKATQTNTEYGFVSGGTGVARDKPANALTASEKARLRRIGASTTDPATPRSENAWRGLREP